MKVMVMQPNQSILMSFHFFTTLKEARSFAMLKRQHFKGSFIIHQLSVVLFLFST